jgi:hypothetical protein
MEIISTACATNGLAPPRLRASLRASVRLLQGETAAPS